MTEASVLMTQGESNDWRAVSEMASDPYCDIINKSIVMYEEGAIQEENSIAIYDVEEWRYFIFTLGKRAKYLGITLPDPASTSDEKKSKKKKGLSAAEIIGRQDKARREEMIDAIDGGFDDANHIRPNPTKKYNNTIVCVFLIIKWVINMYKHIDEHFANTPENLILDCVCSASRMRQDISHFPDFILEGVDALIEKLKERYARRVSPVDENQRMARIMRTLFSNERLFIESTWEKIKPNSRKLYSEQKEIYDLVRSALQDGRNAPLFATYKVSPGSGKTFLAAVLAALIEYGHRLNKRDETLSRAIHTYERDMSTPISISNTHVYQGNQKILLYSCYNVQVRNMVAGLCRDADVAFWVASSYIGERDGIQRTTLRPFKTLYTDFRAARKARDDPMRHGSIDEQWIFNLEHTNRQPAIIIADPESCSVLLDAYPERFVGYFDEVTAGAEEGVTSDFARHTCNLLKKAPRQTILLSATLQNMEQLEWCRIPFIARHTASLPEYRDRVFERSLLTGESWKSTYADSISKIRRMDYMNFYASTYEPIIAEVQSSRLNISCSAYAPISDNGHYYAYMPHMRLTSMDQLSDFITRLEHDSALIRMYSPEAVYHMVTENAELIPSALKFTNYFANYGLVKHASIRNYILDLFRNIASDNNALLFEALRAYTRPMLSEREIARGITIQQEKILTTNAYLYDSGKVIQVSTSSRMPSHLSEISRDLLDGSPSLEALLQNYREQEELLNEKLANVKVGSTRSDQDGRDSKSHKTDARDIEQRKADIAAQYAPKLRYARRFLVNSTDHFNHFVREDIGRTIHDTSNVMLTKDTIQKCVEHDIDETIVKLLMSGVAIRDVARMGNFERDLYERGTRIAKFFISDSSIVYGTNIKGVNSISVTSDYAASPISTRNSIYQLMGRAGRSGQSYSARIIFHSMEGIEKLFGNENYEGDIMCQIASGTPSVPDTPPA